MGSQGRAAHRVRVCLGAGSPLTCAPRAEKVASGPNIRSPLRRGGAAVHSVQQILCWGVREAYNQILPFNG